MGAGREGGDKAHASAAMDSTPLPAAADLPRRCLLALPFHTFSPSNLPLLDLALLGALTPPFSTFPS